MPVRRGLLLINLGTPDSLSHEGVRAYLKEFLMDPLVLDMPTVLRWLLLQGVILPFRTKHSLEAYRQVWMAEGSPLMFHSMKLCEEVRALWAGEGPVELAMRYGQPSIPAVVSRITRNCDELYVLPLYPQYALSSTLTAIHSVSEALKSSNFSGPVFSRRDFYQEEGFLQPMARQIEKQLQGRTVDHLLFSFHGLPLRHCRKSSATTLSFCQGNECCQKTGAANELCYRAQCFRTADLLVERLRVKVPQWSVSFQSRLKGDKWIKPYTDEVFMSLPQQGVKSLAVVCPSFVADCLETLEEIDIRGRESFLQSGGEAFHYIPCLNSSKDWAAGVVEIASRALFRLR